MKKTLKIIIGIFLFIFNVRNVYAIKINSGDIYLGVGNTYTLTTSEAGSSALSWSSTNTSVATVSATTGQVTGVSLGSAYISVTDGKGVATCKVSVIDNYIKVTAINTKRASDTITVNETKNIGASVSPNNASNKAIRYYSSSESIVKVDSSGNITGVRVGKASITIAAETKSIIYNVTVVDNVKLTGISVNQSYTINEGATAKLTVTYTPSNASNKGVTWKSSNNDIVTVDGAGNIKGISSGTATITVTSSEGGYSATSKITVNAVDRTLKGITLSKSTLTLEIGKSETLTVNYNPTNAKNKNVTWRSSNSSIVSVDNGKITANKAGVAEIKAISEEGDFEAICKVTVPSTPIKSISFANESETIRIGDKLVLETVSDPVDSFITNPIWTSSDESVATISDTGEVEGIAVGETTITISDKDGKVKSSTTVKVLAADPKKLTITIEGYDIGFDVNKTQYDINIKNEDSLNITTNYPASKVEIAGNRDLQNGSIVTVTIKNNGKRQTYTFKIHKRASYLIYILAAGSIILIGNIIRVLIKNKKKKNK